MKKFCGISIKKVRFYSGRPFIIRKHTDGYYRKYYGKISRCLYCNKKYFSVDLKSFFCSCLCLGRYRSKDKNPCWRGGKSKVHGYIIIRATNHPKNNGGYVREHRLIMESVIGRLLRNDEDVHHINGNKADNRIENLQLLTHGKHTTMTNNKRWKNGGKP